MAAEGSEGNGRQQKDSAMTLEARQSGHGDAIMQNSLLLDKLPLELLARVLRQQLDSFAMRDDWWTSSSRPPPDRKIVLKLVCRRFYEAARLFGSDEMRIVSCDDMKRAAAMIQDGRLDAGRIRGLSVDFRDQGMQQETEDLLLAQMLRACPDLEQLAFRHHHSHTGKSTLAVSHYQLNEAFASCSRLAWVSLPDRYITDHQLSAICLLPRLEFLKARNVTNVGNFWSDRSGVEQWSVQTRGQRSAVERDSTMLSSGPLDIILGIHHRQIDRVFIRSVSTPTVLALRISLCRHAVAIDIAVDHIDLPDWQSSLKSMTALDELVIRELAWIGNFELSLLLGLRLRYLRIGGLSGRTALGEMLLDYDILIQSLASLSGSPFTRRTSLVIVTSLPTSPVTGQALNLYRVSNWQPNQRQLAQQAASAVGIDLTFDCSLNVRHPLPSTLTLAESVLMPSVSLDPLRLYISWKCTYSHPCEV